MPTGTIADIKAKLSVVDVVGQHVTLKRAGALYKGICPFHAEKTPSFIVTPGRETWHCFGCGEGGDIFSFVMRRDGLEFREALTMLAERAGVELSERSAREDRRRRRLREALESAFTFYREVLLRARVAEPARAYLAERGFTEEALDRFGVGFAPDDWQALSGRLSARGFAEEELLSAGLAGRGQRGKVYDRFRGRITFPIRDQSGAAIGLGGRILPGADGPKYLNSPATPLFDKSTVLYGIELAKSAMRRERLAVIVEGFTDVIAAHQAGYTNVVASLGTALTGGQVALATRFADAVALAYDVDLAGQAATERGLLEELGPDQSVTKVRVVRIPEGKDPDELIRADPAGWERAVSEATPVIEYFINRAAEGVDLTTVTGRRETSQRVLSLLRRVRDPLEQNLYLQQLARLVSVEESVLRRTLEREPQPRRGSGASAHPGAGRPAPAPATGSAAVGVDTLRPIEREAVQLILRYPLVAAEADALGELPVRDSAASALVSAWRDWRTAGGDVRKLDGFIESLDPVTRDLAQEIAETDGSSSSESRERLATEDALETFRVCILRLRRERIDEGLAEARLLLDSAVRDGDSDRIDEVQRWITGLARERELLDREMSEPAAVAARRG